MRAGVFLDRDGVLNHPIITDGKPHSPMRMIEFRLFDGVAEACARLRSAGFAVVVITNQPEISRGTLDPAELESMHDALRSVVDVDEVRVCPHDDNDGCHCRKPKPGMLIDAAESLSLNLDHSYLVGDRWRDIQAGQAVGCPTVFVNHGWAERRWPGAQRILEKELASVMRR